MPKLKSIHGDRPKQRDRVSFSKIAPTMELPNLISVQKESFARFMTDGLAESFMEFSPIENHHTPLPSVELKIFRIKLLFL